MGSPSNASSSLLKTPLNAVHRRLNARMVEFAGWDMPVQYSTGIIAEHVATRATCGLFDLSHMGRVHVRGPNAQRLAQYCCTRDLSKIPQNQAAYSVLCNDDGGILDDVIAYQLSDDEVVFVFNASNRLSDIAFFAEQRDRLDLNVEIEDRTFETALIGIQGPSAQVVLQAHTSAELESLAGYAFTQTEVAGARALVSRTGYTGEDGFEVSIGADAATHVWSQLMDGGCPCGLGARDTLRTEAGFALYGHDIDRSTNPYEARLGWVVSLDKPSFVGRDALIALKDAGPKRRLVGLRLGRGGVPRQGHGLWHAGRQVGHVTSGTFSPTLKTNIAMGYVSTPELDQTGSSVSVAIRDVHVAAEVVRLPFVPHHSRPRARM